MRRFDAVIFDLDGTLMNTLADIADAAMAAYPGYTVTEEIVLHNVNYGVSHFISGIGEELGAKDDGRDVLGIFQQKYGECYCNKTRPYDGINEILIKIKEKGYKTAVFSNKENDFVVGLCEKKLPKGTYVYARGELKGCPVKPDKAGCYDVMEKLEVTDTNRVIYVGDSDVDMKTALNMGFFCVGVAWGYRDVDTLKRSGASVIAHNADELYDYITAQI